MTIKKFSPNNNQKGMSLVSVLVAASVGMIAMGSMMMLQMQQLRQNQIIQKKLEIVSVEAQLARYLVDQNTCNCLFVSGQASAISMTAGFTSGEKSLTLKNGCSNTNWLSTTSSLPNSMTNLQVETVKLKNVSNVGTNTYQADIEISFSNTDMAMKPITSRQLFRTDGSSDNNITSCVSGAIDMAAVCASNGGTWDSTNSNCALPTPTYSPPGAATAPSGPAAIKCTNGDVVTIAGEYTAGSRDTWLGNDRISGCPIGSTVRKYQLPTSYTSYSINNGSEFQSGTEFYRPEEIYYCQNSGNSNQTFSRCIDYRNSSLLDCSSISSSAFNSAGCPTTVSVQ